MEGKGIDMVEISHRFSGEKPPNSHVDGTDPITAFYGTGNLEVTQLLQLPHISSIGDHKCGLLKSQLGPCWDAIYSRYREQLAGD